MDKLAKNLKEYLAEVTGMNITLRKRDGGNLPYFLTRLYDLSDLTLDATHFIAVFLKQEEEFKPAEFLKHLAQIPGGHEDVVCVVAKTLPSYVRKRMIEKGIAFVIPNVQMYLPHIGMELRSRSGGKRVNKLDRISPATQVVLIYWLLGKINRPVTPLELSKRLFYSTMTMTRALDEMEALEIGKVERIGRERLLTITDEREMVWKHALPRLKSPIRYQKRINEHDLRNQDRLPAGLTALSRQTMLAESGTPEYAVSGDVWKRMEKEGIETIPLEEYGTCVLQVWRYDPGLLEVDGMVDPFSLYLSLQNENDERIEMALEKMMERFL